MNIYFYIIYNFRILKSNPALREQFFINISEGKEEKYQFYKNVYNLVNNSALKNKPVFKSNFNFKKSTISSINKKNLPMPGTLHKRLLKNIQERNNYNNKYLYTDNSKLLIKSISGTNIRNAKPINLDGI